MSLTNSLFILFIMLSNDSSSRPTKNFITRVCSFTSLTVAIFLPRSFRTVSMKVSKERTGISSKPGLVSVPFISLSRSSKIKLAVSARAVGSTPTFCMTLSISGYIMILAKSSLGNAMLVSRPSIYIASSSWYLTYKIDNLSFSVPATTPTTSTKTPTNMFITVNVASKIKLTTTGHMTALPAARSFTNSAFAGRMPSRSKVFIASGTLSKYLPAMSLSSLVICRQATA
mmetsp:Transcript_30341/g.47328  ORF Transcript_30341/g.47328 Transcript_30341/m.47328 type:complete len:229 (+) Transcript_30341:186-872(+)